MQKITTVQLLILNHGKYVHAVKLISISKCRLQPVEVATTGRESAGPQLPPAASLQLCTQSASLCSGWYRVHVAYSAPSVVE